MTIKAGERIPEGTLKLMGKDGPMNVEADEKRTNVMQHIHLRQFLEP